MGTRTTRVKDIPWWRTGWLAQEWDWRIFATGRKDLCVKSREEMQAKARVRGRGAVQAGSVFQVAVNPRYSCRQVRLLWPGEGNEGHWDHGSPEEQRFMLKGPRGFVIVCLVLLFHNVERSLEEDLLVSGTLALVFLSYPNMHCWVWLLKASAESSVNAPSCAGLTSTGLREVSSAALANLFLGFHWTPRYCHLQGTWCRNQCSDTKKRNRWKLWRLALVSLEDPCTSEDRVECDFGWRTAGPH